MVPTEAKDVCWIGVLDALSFIDMLLVFHHLTCSCTVMRTTLTEVKTEIHGCFFWYRMCDISSSLYTWRARPEECTINFCPTGKEIVDLTRMFFHSRKRLKNCEIKMEHLLHKLRLGEYIQATDIGVDPLDTSIDTSLHLLAFANRMIAVPTLEEDRAIHKSMRVMQVVKTHGDPWTPLPSFWHTLVIGYAPRKEMYQLLQAAAVGNLYAQGLRHSMRQINLLDEPESSLCYGWWTHELSWDNQRKFRLQTESERLPIWL